MDVGNPSNFIRIQELFNNDLELLKKYFSSHAFTDDKTRKAMKELYNEFAYIADPHGAVGYLGCKEYLRVNPNAQCVFLETAHPVKFLDTVEETLKIRVTIPLQIQAILPKEKVAIKISRYEELKTYLNSKCKDCYCIKIEDKRREFIR